MAIDTGRALALGFDLTEEQRLIYSSTRELAHAELAPGAAAR